MPTVIDVVSEVMVERARQDEQWGGPVNDDKNDWYDWRGLIYRQQQFMSMEGTDHARRQRLIKIAALALAAVESMDRKKHAAG